MSSTVAIDDMPEAVHTCYAYLLDNTDTEPTVERVGYGRILLTHRSDRVHMTVTFRLNGRTWGRSDSKLLIDGQRVTEATGWDMYVSIFKDPDNGRRNFVPEGAKKPKLPESRPVEEQYAPKAVADAIKRIRSSPLASRTTVTVAIALDQSRYLLKVSAEGEDITAVALFKMGEGTSTWFVDQLLLLNFLGYDVLPFQGDLLKKTLMGVLGSDSRANQVSFIPGGRKQGAAVTNSTEVRKATVVRT